MRIDNNTIAVAAISIGLIIGIMTKQTEIATAAMGALAGFVTAKATNQ